MANDVFLRYEVKYLLDEKQYRAVRKAIDERLQPDVHGETTIQSLYFDTDDFRLVRASIEKPPFKEKLRLRCYGANDCDKDVFLEMKRKANGLVYKRRVVCKESNAADFLRQKSEPTQIDRELEYFIRFYQNLSPKMLILYDRSAFFDPNSDLRVTFDRNVRYRTERLDFQAPLNGKPLVDETAVLMELKSAAAFPLWLCKILSEEKIYPRSFSKFGAAYRKENEINLLRSTPLCSNLFSATEQLARPAFSSF